MCGYGRGDDRRVDLGVVDHVVEGGRRLQARIELAYVAQSLFVEIDGGLHPNARELREVAYEVGTPVSATDDVPVEDRAENGLISISF